MSCAINQRVNFRESSQKFWSMMAPQYRKSGKIKPKLLNNCSVQEYFWKPGRSGADTSILKKVCVRVRFSEKLGRFFYRVFQSQYFFSKRFVSKFLCDLVTSEITMKLRRKQLLIIYARTLCVLSESVRIGCCLLYLEAVF